MVSDSEYFSHLYEIASTLNKEFSLHAALRKALEKTVQLLELETGWIWLMQKDRTVYLAASYNLPPALRDHPERLSGRCYCIEKYLANNINKALNISEIACTRLKDIKSGANDLKFHATIPINISSQKVGLINVLSKQTQELDPKQLSVLNTISELVGMVIQRTQAQEAYPASHTKTSTPIHDVLQRAFSPKLAIIVSGLLEASEQMERTNLPAARQSLQEAVKQVEQLQNQLSLVLNESQTLSINNDPPSKFNFPATALTTRELELLALVKKGFTNKQIGEALFISERTVKFHITSILSKLAARTRTEAVDIALKRGLIGF